jgi:hypothetical protein
MTPMRAELNFIRPMAARPMLDLSSAGQTNLQLQPRQVEIADADAQRPPPQLATHGFTAVPFAAEPPGPETDLAYKRYFADLCSAALKQATGADFVLGIPAAVADRHSDAVGERAPVAVVHADFTPGSTARLAAQLLANATPARRPRRAATYNAWWLAREGPQDRPLALCDGNSIAGGDIQVGQVQVPGPGDAPRDYGEAAFQIFNPRQRWYWYPRLGPDRLLLFCGFDTEPGQPSLVTHTAFVNQDCPDGAPPRVSVESRCVAFWF